MDRISHAFLEFFAEFFTRAGSAFDHVFRGTNRHRWTVSDYAEFETSSLNVDSLIQFVQAMQVINRRRIADVLIHSKQIEEV